NEQKRTAKNSKEKKRKEKSRAEHISTAAAAAAAAETANSKHVSTVASDSLLRNCVARLAATSNWFIAAPLSMRQQLAITVVLGAALKMCQLNDSISRL
ncbi:hypothetical protein M5D96_010136, partial [Drosophila gunungcola]